MFKKNTSDNYQGLEAEIVSAISHLNGINPASDEYAAIVDQITKLDALTNHKVKKTAVSKDALVAVAGNLAGILLILNYERVGAVTSKALGFVMKSKI